MAAFLDTLSDKHIAFIEQQHLFFVATAAPTGEVNLSPKGMDSLKVLSPTKLIWLNLTGSGNETAAHIQQLNRMTLMWCSFNKDPLILRVYAKAKAIHANDPDWKTWLSHFPAMKGARQVYEVDIHKVQTSCGFAVPFYEFSGDRTQLVDQWQKRGEAALPEYWQKRNDESIDGFDTGIVEIVQALESE
jgi:hypothetical protein